MIMEEKRILSGVSEERLGVHLRRLREERGLSARDVARELKISPAFIEALEQGAYEKLPAKIYALGFLKKFLSLVQAPNEAKWIWVFEREWNTRHPPTKAYDSLGSGVRREEVRVTPRILIASFLIGLIAVISGFVGIRVRRFARSPLLVIHAPQDRAALREPRVSAQGQTDQEARLTVNGRELTIDGSGAFRQELELLEGINELEFVARNRFGKETRAVRYVVVE